MSQIARAVEAVGKTKHRPSVRRAATLVGKILNGELDEKSALGLTPAHAEAVAKHGLAMLKAKDDRSAEAAGRLAAGADPKNARAWFVLGCASARLDKIPQAILAYQQATRLDPSNLRAEVDLAELYLSKLQYKPAAECLERVRARDPNAKTHAGVRAKVLIVKTLLTLEEA